MALEFYNSTDLDDQRLSKLCRECMAGWSAGTLTARFRYARSRAFSGVCYYRGGRIFVNIGRHVDYPYQLPTWVARAVTVGRRWHKPLYTVTLNDAYQLAMFVFAHEFYHWLVKKARRNTRQKESMCDRFATRWIIDRFGCAVRTADGEAVARELWDFQDVDRFVERAKAKRAASCAARKSVGRSFDPGKPLPGEQLLLFTPAAIPAHDLVRAAADQEARIKALRRNARR